MDVGPWSKPSWSAVLQDPPAGAGPPPRRLRNNFTGRNDPPFFELHGLKSELEAAAAADFVSLWMRLRCKGRGAAQRPLGGQCGLATWQGPARGHGGREGALPEAGERAWARVAWRTWRPASQARVQHLLSIRPPPLTCPPCCAVRALQSCEWNLPALRLWEQPVTLRTLRGHKLADVAKTRLHPTQGEACSACAAAGAGPGIRREGCPFHTMGSV